jgi:hypothetical protein
MNLVSKLSSQSSWFTQPEPEHLAHLYQSEDELLTSLTEFIGAGIEQDETCRIVTTRTHMIKLEDRLLSRNFDLDKARKSGCYIVYDASETMAKFIVDGLPDKPLFEDVIGGVVKSALARNKPVRAFGEMVALLWKEGNQEGVAKLESLWDDLIRNFNISLYCAYPRMQFDKSIHGNMLSEIDRLHATVTPAFA